jgi:hypothetical protein
LARQEPIAAPSIPFRFFAAAVGFHVLMWLALLIGADNKAVS